MNENEVQGKKCFIITPIGNDNSDIFRKAKGVIESVIKPVLTHYGFYDVKPAYEINVSGMINTQIINRIIDGKKSISLTALSNYCNSKKNAKDFLINYEIYTKILRNESTNIPYFETSTNRKKVFSDIIKYIDQKVGVIND